MIHVCQVYRRLPKTKEFILERINRDSGKISYIKIPSNKIKRLNKLYGKYKSTYILYDGNTYRVMSKKKFTKNEIESQLEFLKDISKGFI